MLQDTPAVEAASLCVPATVLALLVVGCGGGGVRLMRRVSLLTECLVMLSDAVVVMVEEEEEEEVIVIHVAEVEEDAGIASDGGC